MNKNYTRTPQNELPKGETFDLRDLEPYGNETELMKIILDMLYGKYGYNVKRMLYSIENGRVVITNIKWNTEE